MIMTERGPLCLTTRHGRDWSQERERVLFGRVAQLVENQTLLDPGGST